MASLASFAQCSSISCGIRRFGSFPTTSSVGFPLPSTPVRLPSISAPTSGKLALQLRSSVEAIEGVEEKSQSQETRRKLAVLNLPWSYSVQNIKELFAECGSVDDVDIIKQKDGRNRGFAFVTMSSAEEAQAAIEKFDASELVGRIIRVEFAKKFKKPPPASPTSPVVLQAPRRMVYASNLSWKARSSDLRELFSSSNFNPTSARVVFESSAGRSAGYGFVCFATEEEAESAISQLNGKELLGRPVQLKLSEKKEEE